MLNLERLTTRPRKRGVLGHDRTKFDIPLVRETSHSCERETQTKHKPRAALKHIEKLLSYLPRCREGTPLDSGQAHSWSSATDRGPMGRRQCSDRPCSASRAPSHHCNSTKQNRNRSVIVIDTPRHTQRVSTQSTTSRARTLSKSWKTTSQKRTLVQALSSSTGQDMSETFFGVRRLCRNVEHFFLGYPRGLLTPNTNNSIVFQSIQKYTALQFQGDYQPTALVNFLVKIIQYQICSPSPYNVQ